MSRITKKKSPARTNVIATSSAGRSIKAAPLVAHPRWRTSWLILGLAIGIVIAIISAVLSDKPDSPPTSNREGIVAAPSDADTGRMIRIAGGTFTMGSDEDRSLECDAANCCGKKDALPLHTVELSGFWMDETPVTNDQFRRFVEATGYITRAEQEVDNLPPGSFVFLPHPGITSLKDHREWWKFIPGANWRHPDGPDSNLDGKDDHPVVQVCYDDALAYCKWAGKRLPTEAEFEYAVRGGLHQKRYVWGDELTPGGKWKANIWQGKFPYENTQADGFRTTAPVKAFDANGYGLFGMSGNVWQWCSDWYRPDYYEKSPRLNPQGPENSYDPAESEEVLGDPKTRQLRMDPRTGRPIVKRVQRGGSFLCSDMYCKGYMPGSRGKGDPGDAANHIGFRCVRSAD